MEPFDVFDPSHPIRGKKRFDRNFRPNRTRIDLGQKAEDSKTKKKEKIKVAQSFLDEFEIKYAANCDQQATRLKNRNVSSDSPFDPRNKPPAQHLIADALSPAPHSMNNDTYKKFVTDKRMAGSLTKMGTKILDEGPKKAGYIVTYPWKDEQYETSGGARA